MVCLVLLTTPRVQGYDPNFIRRIYTLGKHVLPIKWQLHVLNYLPKSPAKRFAVQDLITSYVAEIMKIGFGPEDTEIHIEREDGQILQELLDIGLPTEGIPDAVGGSWSFEQSAKWCRERATAERHKYHNLQSSPQQTAAATASPARPVAESIGVPTEQMSRVTSTSTMAGASSCSSVVMDEATKLAQMRTSNVIHSRRKRDRRRKEFADL